MLPKVVDQIIEALSYFLIKTDERYYPVGTIYETVLSVNPNNILGFGTWEEFGSGRVLVGVDTTQTEFDEVKKTGGAKTVTLTANQMPSHTHTGPSHTHTGPNHSHTQPAHTHTFSGTIGSNTHNHGLKNYGSKAASGTGAMRVGSGGSDVAGNTVSDHTHTHTISGTIGSGGNQNTGNAGTGNTGASGTGATGSAGGGQAHSNLQPYITCYRWVRTA